MTKPVDGFMPQRDPGFWQHVLSVISHMWPQAYAAGMAVTVAVVRSIQAGGKPLKVSLEAVLCGCLTVSAMPVLDHLGFGPRLSLALGGTIGFLGTEWIRERATIIADAALSWWRK